MVFFLVEIPMQTEQEAYSIPEETVYTSEYTLRNTKMYKPMMSSPSSATLTPESAAAKLAVFGTKNPFTYGKIASGEDFVGREKEITKLLNAIRLGESTIICSPNGMGKSSLLAGLARRSLNEFIFAHVNLTGITGEAALLGTLTKETMAATYGAVEAFPPEAWGFLTNPKLRSAAIEDLSLGFSNKFSRGSTALSAKHRTELGEEERQLGSKTDIRLCPRCGHALKWVEKYSRHYCYSCERYAPIRRKMKRPMSPRHGSPIDEIRCPRCRNSLRFVHKYSEYYCERCKRYPMMDSRKRDQEKPTMADLVEVLDLPERIADQSATRIVVMFDDFHEIAMMDNPEILETMRQRFEMHSNVSYIFAGSNKQILHRIFIERSGPFANFAHWIDLGPIPENQLAEYLVRKFVEAKGRLAKDVADLIIGVSGGYPYYVQKIAHELFHISPSPTLHQAEDAVISVIRHQSSVYSVLWDSMKSPLHRKYLLAAAKEPRVPHGEEFVLRHGLKSRSHVQRTEKQLELKGIISDGEIVDPMLVLWLRSTAYT